MPFCTRCGAEYSVGQPHCVKCGSPLPDLTQPAAVVVVEGPRPAPAAKRAIAGGIDLAIAAGTTVYYWRIIAPRMLLRSRRAALVGILFEVLPAVYLVMRDTLGGKSIGKLLFGLTTFSTSKRRPAGIADSILRNIIFGFLIVPVLGWGVFAVVAAVIGVQILSGSATRWGDGLGQTIVVADAELRRRA